MRLITAILFSALFVFATSCAKDKTTANLSLIQGKWSITSFNDPALRFRYVGQTGDYIDFGTNDKAYYYLNGTYDTVAYSLSDLGQKITLYDITNGIQSKLGSTFNILALNSTIFVFSSPYAYPSSTDSSKR